MVYVLAMPELFYTIQMIYNRTQEVIPLLMVGAVWYLVITTCCPPFSIWWNAALPAANAARR
jgi:ABC-type amino acid transport system permease subunit